MNTIEIYDPALCCSTGVCGPSPDTELAAFASTVEAFKAAGIAITRYNLAQEPLAFAQNSCVKSKLESDGESILPLTFINGKLHVSGIYPTRAQLEKLLGIELPKADSCCTDDDNCCSQTAEKAPVAFVKVEAPKASPAKDSCCDPSTGCC